MPPGVWQALAGLVAGLAGKAGWMKLRKPVLAVAAKVKKSAAERTTHTGVG